MQSFKTPGLLLVLLASQLSAAGIADGERRVVYEPETGHILGVDREAEDGEAVLHTRELLPEDIKTIKVNQDRELVPNTTMDKGLRRRLLLEAVQNRLVRKQAMSMGLVFKPVRDALDARWTKISKYLEITVEP